jgi:hypothetical protein
VTRKAPARSALAAWRAVWHASAADEPIPAWALDYLADAADALLTLAARARIESITDAQIVEALGLKGRGRGTVMRREHIAHRNYRIAQHIACELRDGAKLDIAYDTAAVFWKVNRKTARDAWAQHRSRFQRRRKTRKPGR